MLIEKGKSVNIQDIYNECSKMWKKVLQGKTPAQYYYRVMKVLRITTYAVLCSSKVN